MGLYDKLSEKSFLKKLLIGVDADFVERFLTIKQNYETATDKEDKRMYRDKFSAMYWELYTHIAKMINPEMSTAKRLYLRFGVMDLRYLTPEDQEAILKRPITAPSYENDTIFYADEWLLGILQGKIKPSAVDETEKAPKGAPSGGGGGAAMASGRQEKFQATLKVEEERLVNFLAQRATALESLTAVVESLKELHQEPESTVAGAFSKEQLAAFDGMPNIQKEIRRLNKEISTTIKTIDKAKESLKDLEGGEDAGGGFGGGGMVGGNMAHVVSEVDNIRQMHKMTVGRQGNLFPYLSSQNIPKETKDYLYKETVKKKLDEWLKIDPEAFFRTYKGENHNIPPYFILVPGYGTMGVCWEPLDPQNKQFSKGRISLPIYTRIPDASLLMAVGDIRWQVAKELASYYWMEEGLTGRYYEYYLNAKLKGDLKSLFVKDYVLWMTKETQGVQKLEQDARYVFWRYVPMPDDRKVMLAAKGYYYNQLWEKEQVWRKSGKK
ncbi:MAG: hypothetical protein ACRCS8_01015 [Brevinema sp.]